MERHKCKWHPRVFSCHIVPCRTSVENATPRYAFAPVLSDYHTVLHYWNDFFYLWRLILNICFIDWYVILFNLKIFLLCFLGVNKIFPFCSKKPDAVAIACQKNPTVKVFSSSISFILPMNLQFVTICWANSGYKLVHWKGNSEDSIQWVISLCIFSLKSWSIWVAMQSSFLFFYLLLLFYFLFFNLFYILLPFFYLFFFFF